jgi:hypothetical protein
MMSFHTFSGMRNYLETISLFIHMYSCETFGSKGLTRLKFIKEIGREIKERKKQSIKMQLKWNSPSVKQDTIIVN